MRGHERLFFFLVAISLLLLAVQIGDWRENVGAPPGKDPTLTIGPYIQTMTPDRALICWKTDLATTDAVAYGASEQYDAVLAAEQVGGLRCASLVGLEPYHEYHYGVLSNNEALSPDYSFKTLAGPDQQRIQFVAWGDNRTNFGIHQRLAGLVEEAGPDFVVNTGDLVESGGRKSDWNLFFAAEQGLLARTPLFAATGNHDGKNSLLPAFLPLTGSKKWYSVDSGPCHIASLDVVYSDYRPGSEQYNWLEHDLQETSRPWKIVFMHYPPFAFGSFWAGDETLKTVLTPLFERYGVQLVLSGHDHAYQRNVVNGVTYIVTGGGGAPLHRVGKGPPTAYAETTYHFVKIGIDGTELIANGVRLDGSEFDSFSLSLSGGPAAGSTEQEPAGSVPPGPGVVERLSCSRCHEPFRLTSGQLLLYGLSYHRTFTVVAGLALVLLFAGALLLNSRAKGRKNRRGA